RRQYSGIGLYPPGLATPKGHLNLWAGFAVTPKEGDWSKLRNHIEKVICGGDPALFNYVMDWQAHIYQHPSEKPGTALVLKSEVKGTGKSLLIGVHKRLLGGHAVVVDKSDLLVGRFNGHLQRAILLGGEEAFWAGNKAAHGTLKSLITEGDITIELKGVN